MTNVGQQFAYHRCNPILNLSPCSCPLPLFWQVVPASFASLSIGHQQFRNFFVLLSSYCMTVAWILQSSHTVDGFVVVRFASGCLCPLGHRVSLCSLTIAKRFTIEYFTTMLRHVKPVPLSIGFSFCVEFIGINTSNDLRVAPHRRCSQPEQEERQRSVRENAQQSRL